MVEIDETASSLLEKLARFLEKPYPAIGLGSGLAVVLIIVYHLGYLGAGFFGAFFTVLHVISGITWIGLLYYFNLVQTPVMPMIPAELKPAIGKYIAPEALWWFRWSALATVVTGLIVFSTSSAVHNLTIITGALIGLLMAFNVWFIIWPNQQKVLGLVPADDDAKAKSARLAMLTSRANFVLSIPLLYCMVTARLLVG
ncbi:MAG TPA: urate hydroxylase PuuD [Methylocella sp.]|nr:urate hydroxylase PuuD [Methylocella sp.]